MLSAGFCCVPHFAIKGAIEGSAWACIGGGKVGAGEGTGHSNVQRSIFSVTPPSDEHVTRPGYRTRKQMSFLLDRSQRSIRRRFEDKISKEAMSGDSISTTGTGERNPLSGNLRAPFNTANTVMAMMITPMMMVMSKMITTMMFLEQNWFRHWLEPLGLSHRCFRRNHLLLSVRININIIFDLIITFEIVTIFVENL